MQMVGGFGVLLNGMSPSDTSSQGGISMKKEAKRVHQPEVMGDSKETVSSRHSGTEVFVNSWRL